MRYIDQSTLDEAAQAIRDGVTLSVLAGHLRCDTEYLGRLLQLPTAKPVPATQAADEFDLWSTDKLDGLL